MPDHPRLTATTSPSPSRGGTPCTANIDEQGITPDVTVPLPPPDQRFSLEAQSADPASDPQLQRSLQVAGS
ncbi:MAG: hypothetical protein ACR2GX_09205 [Candidatus Dormibacteria bacterium]